MDPIEKLLTRAVDTVYPTKDELEKVLRSGKKLTLYMGFDPTGDKLHIGHMVGLMKMADWQKLGHHVIFLIGDGTGQAGDPSGKTKSRDTFFTKEQLRQNAKDYVMQASKIVDFEGDNPIEIRYNGDWLNKLDLLKILEIANHFSLQQLLERDLYQERMKQNETVNLREFLYPLLQGYDSVAMGVDLEIGGTDQTFNMLIGRQLVKDYLNKEKFVMTTPLLADAQGNKIGKTEGNAIAITDAPEELYRKIMSLPDDVIMKGFEYLTRIPMEDIKSMNDALQNGENPMTFKKRLAYEIVKHLNDSNVAEDAKKRFEATVQRHELPTDVKQISLSRSLTSTATVAQVLLESEITSSISEGKRVTQQGGTVVAGTKVSDPNDLFNKYAKEGGTIVQVGKRPPVKIVEE